MVASPLPSPALLMISRHYIIFRLIVSACLWQLSGTAQAATVDFTRDIAPIIEQRCIRCHNDSDRQGELSLSTAKGFSEFGLAERGEPTDNLLFIAITSTDGEPPAMPKEGDPVPKEQVELIRLWLAEGARWPSEVVVRPRSKADSSWWSLQPLSRTEPPTVSDNTIQHPIDRFIRSKLAKEGLDSSPLASRHALIRRVYFDLVGLPPTPNEVADFIADDDPEAYEKLVDRLLDSPHFGERWARHWLDIAHYADTHGFERDKRRDNAWRYRDYVIRAFNEDKPYDRFIREQIAGDVIAPDDAESVIATGFLAAGPWDFVGQVETKSPVLNRAARALDLDDMVTQVMTATTAMTVNCARCHDHKLDPITQREYYQLTAVFAGLKRAERDTSAKARQEYDAKRAQLESQISRLASDIGRLEGVAFDLADVVGGGNGFGSGKKGIGIDARTGKIQDRPFGDLGNVKPGNYASCEYELVDGVFVPAGQATQITSTKLVASSLPMNSGKAWDMIRNGPVASQFSTKLGAIDYNTDGHSMLGLHANAGITFDLAAIRKSAWPDNSSDLKFSTVVGYGGRTVEPSAEFWILLDGKLQASQRVGRNDAVSISFEIAHQARFLTLISTDGGDGYGHDQISFGDSKLQPVELEQSNIENQQRLAELRQNKAQLEGELKSLGEPPAFFGVVAETPPTVNVLLRGNPETAGVSVAPGTLGWKRSEVVFGDESVAEGERRRKLADWIVSAQNPLTTRVIVNRLWHWHFGQGIVGTPSDFGYGGGKPTHPELLDWLANNLVEEKWSLKAIHRLIVTSQTYRQSSRTANPKALSTDTDNRLLWRMNTRRLEAEAIRDSVLAVTGKLNGSMFGPGYRDFDYEEAYAPIYTYKTADSPELWRRSIYRFIVRTTPPQFMTALDCPDPANLTPKRNVTTTALQSLAMFNNEFMLRQSQYFSERIEAEANTLDDQIELAFRLAFGRSVTQTELVGAKQLVEEHGLVNFCRALLNTNEFVYVD